MKRLSILIGALLFVSTSFGMMQNDLQGNLGALADRLGELEKALQPGAPTPPPAPIPAPVEPPLVEPTPSPEPVEPFVIPPPPPSGNGGAPTPPPPPPSGTGAATGAAAVGAEKAQKTGLTMQEITKLDDVAKMKSDTYLLSVVKSLAKEQADSLDAFIAKITTKLGELEVKPGALKAMALNQGFRFAEEKNPINSLVDNVDSFIRKAIDPLQGLQNQLETKSKEFLTIIRPWFLSELSSEKQTELSNALQEILVHAAIAKRKESLQSIDPYSAQAKLSDQQFIQALKASSAEELLANLKNLRINPNYYKFVEIDNDYTKYLQTLAAAQAAPQAQEDKPGQLSMADLLKKEAPTAKSASEIDVFTFFGKGIKSIKIQYLNQNSFARYMFLPDWLQPSDLAQVQQLLETMQGTFKEPGKLISKAKHDERPFAPFVSDLIAKAHYGNEIIEFAKNMQKNNQYQEGGIQVRVGPRTIYLIASDANQETLISAFLAKLFTIKLDEIRQDPVSAVLEALGETVYASQDNALKALKADKQKFLIGRLFLQNIVKYMKENNALNTQDLIDTINDNKFISTLIQENNAKENEIIIMSQIDYLRKLLLDQINILARSKEDIGKVVKDAFQDVSLEDSKAVLISFNSLLDRESYGELFKLLSLFIENFSTQQDVRGLLESLESLNDSGTTTFSIKDQSTSIRGLQGYKGKLATITEALKNWNMLGMFNDLFKIISPTPVIIAQFKAFVAKAYPVFQKAALLDIKTNLMLYNQGSKQVFGKIAGLTTKDVGVDDLVKVYSALRGKFTTILKDLDTALQTQPFVLSNEKIDALRQAFVNAKGQVIAELKEQVPANMMGAITLFFDQWINRIEQLNAPNI